MKYVALLRGINVGGNNKVSMKYLKEIFSSLQFTDITTYINSGNIIFESQEPVQKIKKLIETSLVKHFDFQIMVILRDARAIHTLIQNIPLKYTNDTIQKTDILFLSEEFDTSKTVQKLTINKDVDTVFYSQGAIIWNVERCNYLGSGMKKFIGTDVYKNMTARNINTVRKLAELLENN